MPPIAKDLIVGVTTARVINTLGFGTNYYKIDNVETGTAEDSQGLTTLILKKRTPCFDGQRLKFVSL